MYKYAKKEFNDLLINMGIVRIGTQDNFKKLEHGYGIADPSEGTKSITHSIEYFDPSNTTNSSEETIKNRNALSAFGAMKGNALMKKCRLTKEFMTQNVFIFCTSSMKSTKVMEGLADASSCVEIVNHEEFYNKITQRLHERTPVEFMGFFDVQYQNRNEEWNGQDWGGNPSLIKPPKYEVQKEIRAIWQAKDHENIEPVTIGDYNLGRYCKRIDL